MNNWYDILPISQISHRLFVGGHAAAAALVVHNPHHITAVLNVDQKPDVKRSPEIVYMHVPFDDGETIPARQFAKCLGWLSFMYENGHVILVHCAAGISRSVTIMASFMHYVGIADFDVALSQIHAARPVSNPAPAVQISAKQMLGVWPYDGSMGDTAPEHERMMHDAFVWMDATRAAQAHTDPNCPTKVFLLSADETDNRPRHLILCTCTELSGIQSGGESDGNS